MQDNFNLSAGIAGDEQPVWMLGNWPTWGRHHDDDVDEGYGNPIAQAMEDLEAVFSGIDDMREAFEDHASLGEDEAARAGRKQAIEALAAVQREAFDRELSESVILQKPMRVSRPLTLRFRR